MRDRSGTGLLAPRKSPRSSEPPTAEANTRSQRGSFWGKKSVFEPWTDENFIYTGHSATCCGDRFEP